MSRFIKSQFTEGEFVTYNGQFVARFKRGGRGSFLTFLVKNFTVEEYFSRMQSGEPPLTILQSKGYLQPHIERMLRDYGYPVTTDGYNMLLNDRVTGKFTTRI